MKTTQRIAAAALLFLSATPCLAQDAPAAPTVEAVRDDMRQVMDGMRQDTLKHREEMRADYRKELRQEMAKAGIGDRNVQNVVLDFVQDQDTAREEARAAFVRCKKALDDLEQDDASIQRHIDFYQGIAARSLKEREIAVAALDGKIQFSKNPRLKLFLMMNGIIGNEAWITSEQQSEIVDAFDLEMLFPAEDEE